MTDQLSFEALLSIADDDNHRRRLDRETGHLPGTMDEALPFFRELLSRHHERMMAADVEAVMALREEAHRLAFRLNGGDPGILAGPDAPGCALARQTAAEDGAVPLWGQCGNFVIETCGMRVRIEIDGVFGICASHVYWPGFSAHAVDLDAPFLSETGYRSFVGIHADPCAGLGPAEFCARTIEAHVKGPLKGRLRAIRKDKRS